MQRDGELMSSFKIRSTEYIRSVEREFSFNNDQEYGKTLQQVISNIFITLGNAA